MIEGKPTVFISYAEAFKSLVAVPFREFLASLGLYGILVGEEPLPEAATDWDPEAKVVYFLDSSQMFVALATPDQAVDGGNATRQNIIDEIRMARERSHLRNRIQVFKASTVKLPSNINPTHEPLDPADVAAAFPAFERQARAFQLLGPAQDLAGGPEEPSPPEQDGDSGAAPSGKAAEQAVNALGQLAAFLQGDAVPDPGAIAARAHLASSTALVAHRSADLLGVHEINGLFRERMSVEPTASEAAHLLRTIIAHIGASNAPGWYWFRNLSSKEVQEKFADVAISDSDHATQRAAIELLAHSTDQLPTQQLRSIVRSTLEGDENSPGVSALELLEQQGNRRDLRSLRSALDEYTDEKRMEQATVTVLAGDTPALALQQALDNPAHLNSTAEDRLLRSAAKIPDAAARRAVQSSSPILRKLGLRLRNSTSRLHKVDVEKIIDSDSEASVRCLAAELAIRRRWRLSQKQLDAALEDSGWDFDRKVEIKVAFWALFPGEKLLDRLDWYDIESDYIYEALARMHFEIVRDRIVDDLASDFQKLKDRAEKRLEDELRDAVTADIRKKFGVEEVTERQAEIEERVSIALDDALKKRERFQDFLLRRFRSAALAGLAKNGTADHLEIARRFLDEDNRDLTRSCIALIERVGTSEDVPALLSIASKTRGDIQWKAAAAAVRLADDPVETGLELLHIRNREVVEVALGALAEASLERVLPSILALLRDGGLSVRDIAIEHLIARMSTAQLRKLPDLYAQGQYFYNVVVRVDRALYAPGWVRRSADAILDFSFRSQD